MISLKEITKHYSDKENRIPQLVLKEYLQYKILDSIFSSKYGDDLVFMGGAAVRIVYGSDRFSEDLDLDNRSMSPSDFGDLARHIQKELEGDGLTVEFRNTIKNVYHCYLKFPKILFENNLSPLQDEKILIRLDSFQTKKLGKIESHILARADVFSEIRVYSKEIILSQKIDALFHRERSKGRDLYDIVYLFSFTDPDYGYLQNILGISNKRELIEKMKKLFSEKELALLARDVKPFLLDAKKIKQVEKFNAWLTSIRV
jgi:predicted nucleotidyltransferase component of viral defense system